MTHGGSVRSIQLTKEGATKLRNNNRYLNFKDIENCPKGVAPGEWLIINDTHKELKYLSYANNIDHPSGVTFTVCELVNSFDFSIENWIVEKIQKSIDFRNKFISYQQNARIIFGAEDGLPGLTIDSYVNCIFISIQGAGFDAHRDHIKDFLYKKFPEKNIYILNNNEYRLKNNMPIYDTETPTESISVVENGIKYEIPINVMQKIGYYYDHRENRKKIEGFISQLVTKPKTSLDLFCYVGSWGLNLIKAGCTYIDFVDQGDLAESIEQNIKLNNFNNDGKFTRSDVFKYLDECIKQNKKYELICSDPPAFAKTKNEAKRAIEGYLKLHKKCLQCLSDDSYFVAASCTHYVTLDEFQGTVYNAAKQLGVKIRLLDIGIQGYDHSTSNLDSKSNYIKYCLYKVDKHEKI